VQGSFGSIGQSASRLTCRVMVFRASRKTIVPPNVAPRGPSRAKYDFTTLRQSAPLPRHARMLQDVSRSPNTSPFSIHGTQIDLRRLVASRLLACSAPLDEGAEGFPKYGGILKQQGSPVTPACLGGSTVAYGRACATRFCLRRSPPPPQRSSTDGGKNSENRRFFSTGR